MAQPPEYINRIGQVDVPLGGGGMKPTVQVMVDNVCESKQHMEIKGPTCFGGLMSKFEPVHFTGQNSQGSSSVLIERKPPAALARTSARAGCLACCTTSDVFQMDTSGAMSPEEKANMLGSLMLLEYQFFEQDEDICSTRSDGTIVIHCCNCYCQGYVASLPLLQHSTSMRAPPSLSYVHRT